MAMVVLAFSGGMDSATLFADLMKKGHDVFPVVLSYPSKHNKWEGLAATKFLSAFAHKNPVTRVDVSALFAYTKSDLLVTGGKLPKGHYEAESMKRTVVPMRNTIFASVLGGFAESLLVGTTEPHAKVALGIHAGDHAIYPDCRPSWRCDMNAVLERSSEGKVGLETPYIAYSKAEILRIGLELGVPYQLTRTCYSNDMISCGTCGACQERLEAFDILGTADPLAYRTRELLPR